MSYGLPGAGLACGRALAVAGGQGSCGHGAEQGCRARVAREMEKGMRPQHSTSISRSFIGLFV